MRYWLVLWHQTSPDLPIWMFYEVTEDGFVPRMIEHYPDGRTDRRIAAAEGAPSLVHSNFYDPDIDPADPEFTTIEVSAEEFARRWADPL
jgi:hypothetical protein